MPEDSVQDGSYYMHMGRDKKAKKDPKAVVLVNIIQGLLSSVSEERLP